MGVKRGWFSAAAAPVGETRAAAGLSDAGRPPAPAPLRLHRLGPAAARPWRPTWLGGVPLQRRLHILSALLALSLGASLLLGALNLHASGVASTQTQVAGDALAQSQRLARAALKAAQGQTDGLRQLDDSRREVDAALGLLSVGGVYRGHALGGAEADPAALLARLRKTWAPSDHAAGTLLRLTPELTGLERTLRQLDALTPQLLAQTEELSALALRRGGGGHELAALGRLSMLTQRMGRSAAEFLDETSIDADAAALLARDSAAFGATLDGFLDGSEALQLRAARAPELRAKCVQLKERFDEYRRLLSFILDKLEKFQAAKNAEQLILRESEGLRHTLSNLEQHYRNAEEARGALFWLMLGCAALTLLAAAAICRVLLLDSRRRARAAELRRQQADAERQLAQRREAQAKASHERTQAAILLLMNELQDIAAGDLTVQATVTEDITGALADSVNFTLEELRGLVGRVGQTAGQVGAAALQAQTMAGDLLAASQQQWRGMREAAAGVEAVAAANRDLAQSAGAAAPAARQSLAAARQGAAALAQAIDGMRQMRAELQDGVQRSRHSGESAQQLGAIAELLAERAEQTQLLALNAAIQAAPAGAAGRHFAALADQMQGLAERSAQAARQIGALARAIQGDSRDTVAALLRASRGALDGAERAAAAAAALAELDQVSAQLVELAGTIVAASERQAGAAGGAALGLERALALTEQSRDGGERSAQSIHQLSLLTLELKNSVARFRVAV